MMLGVKLLNKHPTEEDRMGRFLFLSSELRTDHSELKIEHLISIL